MRKNQINVGLYEEARKVHDIRSSAQSLCRNERNCRLSAGVSNATPGFKGCSRMGRVVVFGDSSSKFYSAPTCNAGGRLPGPVSLHKEPLSFRKVTPLTKQDVGPNSVDYEVRSP